MQQQILAAPTPSLRLAPGTVPMRLPRRASETVLAPRSVSWQITRAGDGGSRTLVQGPPARRSPHELTTGEALEVVEDLDRLGVRALVLTGSDPLCRDDVLDLVAAATHAGIEVELETTADPRTTAVTLRELAAVGLARLALPVNGATAAVHDGCVDGRGSFRRTLRLLRSARGAGLRARATTILGWHNASELEAIADLLARLEVEQWTVGFLLPGADERPEALAGAEELEALLERVADVAARAPFAVSTLAGPQYRRVAAQRGARRRGPRRATARDADDPRESLFIDYRGEIYPSRGTPLSAGNVLTHDLGAVWRASPLLRALRDSSMLKGKCGSCDFRELCGGSRSRALRLLGDPLEADPYCPYLPPRFARMVALGEAEPPAEHFRRRIRGWPRAPHGPSGTETQSLWEFVNRRGRPAPTA